MWGGRSWGERDREGVLENLGASWDSQKHPASIGLDHPWQKYSVPFIDTDTGE